MVKGRNTRSGDDVWIKHYIHTLWCDYSTVGVVIKMEKLQVKATLFINTSSMLKKCFSTLKKDGQQESLQVKVSGVRV